MKIPRIRAKMGMIIEEEEAEKEDTKITEMNDQAETQAEAIRQEEEITRMNRIRQTTTGQQRK